METGRVQTLRLWGLLVAILVAVALLPQSAYADEAAARSAADGMYKLAWSIDGDDGEYSRGSCFLIDDDHVLTAYHCIMFSTSELAYYGLAGADLQDLRDHMKFSVLIGGSDRVGASYVYGSEEQDWAVLKLDRAIDGGSVLPIRDSRTVKAAEAVYAVGYPASSDLKAASAFAAGDAVLAGGTVTRTEGIYQGATIDGFVVNGNFLQTDIAISGGDAGGPIVDADGNVVGVSVRGSNSFYLAVASDVITFALADLGIDYTPADGDEIAPGTNNAATVPADFELDMSALQAAINQASALNASDYTAESFAGVTAALDDARAAANLTLSDPTDERAYKAAQAQIDDATAALTQAMDANHLEKAPAGLPVWVFILIGVVAVAVVVGLVLVMRKKRAAADAVGGAAGTGSPGAVPQQPSQGGAPMSTIPMGMVPQGAANTATFAGDDDETVLLYKSTNGGTLTRMTTNEQVRIDSAEFTIGRDRNKVSYCVEGNTSISRIHARIIVRDGRVYLIDNKAANGTYVNGIKARPGQEVLLKSGDIITFADEKFKYLS